MVLLLALLAAAPDPLVSMVQTRDEIQGVTWFRDRAQARSNAADSLSCSFARFSSGYGPLRLTISHAGKRSIDPEIATLAMDGASFVLTEARRGLRGCSWRREKAKSGVSETCEVEISTEHPDLLAALLSAKAVKVRLQGDRVHDFQVPKSQLDAIRRVHAAWEAASRSAAGH
ncbi:MAG TPA: hypothetical protein VFL36_23465 [Myxococcales bacterium]|nr:hypothetical protein [Myxococcales bacterium]